MQVQKRLAGGALLSVLMAMGLCGGQRLTAGDVTFIPLAMSQGDTEANTGMWLRPDLGTAADVLPLKTRIWATQESVTGKVAMKIQFDKGSTGKLAWENMEGKLKPGSAGMTFCAKASRACTLTVGGLPVSVGTEWKKIDLPWDKLGTTADKPNLGWQFIIVLNGPIEESTTLILDRIGMETPTFDPNPKWELTAGPDRQISSKDFIYGAENLAPTLALLKAKKPFKLFALGDSVTAGAQTNRGTWGVKMEDGVPFRYFGTAARIWEQKYGYKGITVVACGHGGWTTKQGMTVIDKEVIDLCGADDLVILQFGGNDLYNNVTPEQWKAEMQKMITKTKTKTQNILLLTSTPGGKVNDNAAAMTKMVKELVSEEKVAAFDVTQMMLARGEPFSYAWFANLHHPDFSAHIMLGEMVAPVLTGEHKLYP